MMHAPPPPTKKALMYWVENNCIWYYISKLSFYIELWGKGVLFVEAIDFSPKMTAISWLEIYQKFIAFFLIFHFDHASFLR